MSTPLLDRQIESIRDGTTRSILNVCATKKQYPKDCIVDGALETMTRYILSLEEKVYGRSIS